MQGVGDIGDEDEQSARVREDGRGDGVCVLEKGNGREVCREGEG